MAAFLPPWLVFFFFNDTATTEIYTLSLHDALPILITRPFGVVNVPGACACEVGWAVESPARRCGAAAAVAAAICCSTSWGSSPRTAAPEATSRGVRSAAYGTASTPSRRPV